MKAEDEDEDEDAEREAEKVAVDAAVTAVLDSVDVLGFYEDNESWPFGDGGGSAALGANDGAFIIQLACFVVGIGVLLYS